MQQQAQIINISLSDLVSQYTGNPKGDVRAWQGRLIVRPAYQREFVYDIAQQQKVIDSIMHNFPIGLMYFVERQDGHYEVLDGQQRILSICQFMVSRNYAILYKGTEQYFSALPIEVQQQLENYQISVYMIDKNVSDDEKLDWFAHVNIQGELLNQQEMRNAIFSGSFVSDARRYFAKDAKKYAYCAQYVPYLPTFVTTDNKSNVTEENDNRLLRQKLLELALKWASRTIQIGGQDKMTPPEVAAARIRAYMSKHKGDINANALIEYYENVMNWVSTTFPISNYNSDTRALLKRDDWGKLYDEYALTAHEAPATLAESITKAYFDSEVTRKAGIIPYYLMPKNTAEERNKAERVLSLRTFTENEKIEAYTRQNHKCAICGNEFNLSEMEGDHIVPWSKGGKTTMSNLQMLCKRCNRDKSDR